MHHFRVYLPPRRYAITRSLCPQPSSYGTFEVTQEELDWYGSNPEGVDRDRTPDAVFLDEVMALN